MNTARQTSSEHAISLHTLRQGGLDEAAQRELFSRAITLHADANDQASATDTLFEIADQLTYTLLNEQRYAEAREIAAQALRIGDDSALLHTLALCEHALGENKAAISHLEQALHSLDRAMDSESLAMRCDMLEHLAQMQQSQGQHLRALQNLERAAEQLRSFNDHPGYIRCKTQLAKWAHELGDTMQASEHWLDILALTRSHAAGTPLSRETARALLQLADLAREGENTEMETSLRREALEVLADAGMTGELAHTLFQLARIENQRDIMWQAVWLMLAVTQNIEGLINAHAWLFMREEQKTDPDASLLAAAVWALIESLPDEKISRDIAQQARTKRLALSHLFSCARIQGIHETEISAWMQHEKLRKEDAVMQTMLTRIETMLEASTWRFERGAFQLTPAQQTD